MSLGTPCIRCRERDRASLPASISCARGTTSITRTASDMLRDVAAKEHAEVSDALARHLRGAARAARLDPEHFRGSARLVLVTLAGDVDTMAGAVDRCFRDSEEAMARPALAALPDLDPNDVEDVAGAQCVNDAATQLVAAATGVFEGLVASTTRGACEIRSLSLGHQDCGTEVPSGCSPVDDAVRPDDELERDHSRGASCCARGSRVVLQRRRPCAFTRLPESS